MQVAFNAQDPPTVPRANGVHGLVRIMIEAFEQVPTKGVWNAFPYRAVAALEQESAVLER